MGGPFHWNTRHSVAALNKVLGMQPGNPYECDAVLGRGLE